MISKFAILLISVMICGFMKEASMCYITNCPRVYWQRSTEANAQLEGVHNVRDFIKFLVNKKNFILNERLNIQVSYMRGWFRPLFWPKYLLRS